MTQTAQSTTSFRVTTKLADRADRLAAHVSRGVVITRSFVIRQALDRGLAQLEVEAGVTPPPPVPPGERYVERDAAALAAASIEAI